MIRILQGDCRDVLKTLPEQSINCCVTSPPYFGLRDYGVEGQIGLEPTPEEYEAELVAVFREVRRVLRDDGTLWQNLGDSYASGNKSVLSLSHPSRHRIGTPPLPDTKPRAMAVGSLKPKDLIGVPWMVAKALRDDGWYLRQDIIWHKTNGMPESVTDRCTKVHEYMFLLSKSPRYYYDHEAIAEPQSEHERTRRLREQENGLKTRYSLRRDRPHGQHAPGANGCARSVETRHRLAQKGTRNKRSVWTVSTQPYNGAHFAVFPPALILPCILAGCPAGGTVLDPFGGSGTTGIVAASAGRRAVLIELNPDYIKLAKQQAGLFLEKVSASSEASA